MLKTDVKNLKSLFLQVTQEGLVLADDDDMILSSNDAFAEIFGMKGQDFAGRPLDDFIDAESMRRVSPSLRDYPDEPVEVWGTDVLGDRVSLQMFQRHLKHEDKVIRGLAFRDITQLKRAQENLIKSEERYALAAQGSNDGLWDWDLRNDQVYYSTRWKRIFGLKDDEVIPNPDAWFERVHSEDYQVFKKRLDAHLAGKTPHFEHEFRMRHSDNSYRYVLCRGVAVCDANDKPFRMAGSISDTTENKIMIEQFLFDALHDPLTGLPNRGFFTEKVRDAIRSVEEDDSSGFAVMLIDLDRFKVINDSLGHQTGDHLLTSVSKALEDIAKEEDVVARMGGDEFAMLITNVNDSAEATSLANQIQSRLSLPFELEGRQVFTTASIGMVLGGTEYKRADHVMRDADTAMHKAKALGRARAVIFDISMHDQAMTRMTIENELRTALEQDQFQVAYQPLVEAATGDLAGFEALIRWLHPKRGVIFPGDFIHVAEDTELIVPIGEWILKEATKQLAKWQKIKPALMVSVNLSTKQFDSGGLEETVREALQESGVKPETVKLELTESAVMGDEKLTIAKLQALRDLGCSLAIDDFGTGYSNLSYLDRLPVQILKVDKSFVQKMDIDGDSSGIVGTVLDLAKNLKMDVVAEGVENSDQLKVLTKMGCRYIQGYYFSKPVDVKAATAMVKTRPAW